MKTKKRLEKAIYELPEREREVFILRYLNGLRLSEISEILGIAVGTVKAHLAQGAEKLKEKLLAPIVSRIQTATKQGGIRHE